MARGRWAESLDADLGVFGRVFGGSPAGFGGGGWFRGSSCPLPYPQRPPLHSTTQPPHLGGEKGGGKTRRSQHTQSPHPPHMPSAPHIPSVPPCYSPTSPHVPLSLQSPQCPPPPPFPFISPPHPYTSPHPHFPPTSPQSSPPMSHMPPINLPPTCPPPAGAADRGRGPPLALLWAVSESPRGSPPPSCIWGGGAYKGQGSRRDL